jgi:O-antigen ligase
VTLLKQFIFQPVDRAFHRLRHPDTLSRMYLVPALVIAVGTMLFKTQGVSAIPLLALIGIPVGLLLLLNPEYVFLASVTVLFVRVDALYLNMVVWTSFAVLAALFVNYVPDDEPRARNPLTVPFWILVCTIIPSYYNTVNLGFSLIGLINMVSMAVMAFAVCKLAQGYSFIKLAAGAFLVFALLNGVSVVYETFTTPYRAFGIAGIVYVDFVCIAILMTAVLILFFKRRHVMLLFACIIFFIVALIFTQTRNVIISLMMSFGFFCFLLLKHAEKFKVNRKNFILTVSAAVAVVVLIVFALMVVAPQAFARILDLGTKQSWEVRGAEDFARNSWVTRLLIWHTALNAFLQHPLIGIGAYSFPNDAQYYFTIPPKLFKLFVEGASPHQTLVGVLTETGMLGLAGFLTFTITLFRTGQKAFRAAVGDEQLYFSFGLLVVQFYIFSSMLLTDAWLYGQCGILWSIVIGLSLGNYFIVMRNGAGSGQR